MDMPRPARGGRVGTPSVEVALPLLSDCIACMEGMAASCNAFVCLAPGCDDGLALLFSAALGAFCPSKLSGK